MNFNEYIKNEAILKALNDINITEMTEIQEKAIPHVLEGKDVIGLAQTGTGKTFAYSLPVIEKLDNKKGTKCLILCPTRELALQVKDEINKVLKYISGVLVTCIYGGESYERQIRDLKQKPQIVVGTPGRVIDHLNRKTLHIDKISTLILDEADEMLKMGFKDDMETILSSIKNDHQTLLFSATMPPFIKDITTNYQTDPVTIEIKKKSLTVDKIKQNLYYVKREQKRDLLIRLLDYYAFNSVIIFANTKSMVDELQSYLVKNNYKADSLHGDLKQAQRDKVMNAFKKGNLEILVCTDVAARGIDVKGLEAIINYDLPYENELYVHRIGRTGRAGEDGLSLTLATKSERRKVFEIEKYTKSKMEVKQAPTKEEIEGRLTDKLFIEIESNFDKSIRPNLKLLNKLAHLDIDPANIINSLLEIILKDKRRKYHDIEVIEFNEKRTDDRKKYNDRNEGRKKANYRKERDNRIKEYHNENKKNYKNEKERSKQNQHRKTFNRDKKR